MKTREYRIKFFSSMNLYTNYLIRKKIPFKYAKQMVEVFGWKYGTGSSEKNNGIAVNRIFKESKANQL